MSDQAKPVKPSFWRFGGSLDSIYHWLIGLFFVLSVFVNFSRQRSPEALGASVGQTVVVAIILFIVFKIIGMIRR